MVKVYYIKKQTGRIVEYTFNPLVNLILMYKHLIDVKKLDMYMLLNGIESYKLRKNFRIN